MSSISEILNKKTLDLLIQLKNNLPQTIENGPIKFTSTESLRNKNINKRSEDADKGTAEIEK